MKIAVITAYYKESAEQLTRCHNSVLAQAGDVTHIMVSDGEPHPIVDTFTRCLHLKLPNHDDFGDTPRMVGSVSASAMGFDAISYLDADNWFDADHLLILARTAVDHAFDVVTVARRLFTCDLEELGTCPESDGSRFNDTNCYLILRPAFPALSAWAFKKKSEAVIGDRKLWKAIVDGNYRRGHLSRPTVNYVTTFAFHYLMFNRIPPPHSKVIKLDKDLRIFTVQPYYH